MPRMRAIPRMRRMARTAASPRLRTVTDAGEKGALKRGAKMRSEEDALGSYTGVNNADPYETPVQDADDL